MIYYLLSILWFIRQTKVILFWLYLWQLKEYHFGRFVDHFRTFNGKKIFLNSLFLFKTIFLLYLFLNIFERLSVTVIFLLSFIYLLEVVKALKDYSQHKLKRPVLTKKTTFLILVVIFFNVLSALIWFKREPQFVTFLLVFDILTPIIVSGILLFFQPLTVFWRWQVIRRAKIKRDKYKDLLVIGITGSYGKTSTKEILATVLGEKFNTLKTKEHQNSEVGISQCILNDLKEKQEIFIVEMGAYNRGGIKLLCEITKPKIGILTGINEQHMATFGSQENIIKTKYELIESLPEDGTAFFNGKNKYCLDLYRKTKIKKFLYGQGVKLVGLENIEGVKMVARELGMSNQEISKGLEKIGSDFPGLQSKEGINNSKVFDATYSANPNSVIAHLDYLKNLEGKKIIVMPCLIELDGASKEVHKKIGRKIGEVCDSAIITTKDCFKETKKEAMNNGMKEENILFVEKPKEILRKIESLCRPGDIILLESRVPKKLVDELLIQ